MRVLVRVGNRNSSQIRDGATEKSTGPNGSGVAPKSGEPVEDGYAGFEEEEDGEDYVEDLDDEDDDVRSFSILIKDSYYCKRKETHGTTRSYRLLILAAGT